MCKTVCNIVPPFILEELARRGNTQCKLALNDAHRLFEKRNSALNRLLVQETGKGNSERYVYDSENTYRQRVTLLRKENEQPIEDKTANDVYDKTGYVKDYFKKTFKFDSIDNEGMDIISNIRYGKNYNNAYWDGDEMTFGEGDNVQFKDFTEAIDVIAHEMMHGVTQFTANLDYQSQSGALNEHFSDVFGTVIKQKYMKQDIDCADWLIGDTIVTDKFPGEAIRSMKAPGTANDFDRQPDHMDHYYSGSDDNQGVHINSGIPNKAFYLVAIELGLNESALLWFTALSKLWRTANFRDFVDKTFEAANELIGKEKLSDKALGKITKSFGEVGLAKSV